MKHFWVGLAFACVAAASISLWRVHYDAAFVFATVGALSWFLNYRARMKEIIGEADRSDIHDDESSEVENEQ
jgi:hypothetical protein